MSHTYSKEAKASRAKKMKSYNAAEPKKVDSSDWTPAEPLNADVKTGLRPISKRKFKRGGKVAHKIEGAHSKMRHDRKARKSGGKSGEMPTVDRFVNRDMNKANDYRDGKKHVGGMKKGGRAGKDTGGALNLMNPIMAAGNRLNAMNASGNTGVSGITPGMPTGAAGKSIMRMKGLGMKKGGEAKHPDVAEDKALIKKMVKSSAMKRAAKCSGGKARKGYATLGEVEDDDDEDNGLVQNAIGLHGNIDSETRKQMLKPYTRSRNSGEQTMEYRRPVSPREYEDFTSRDEDEKPRSKYTRENQMPEYDYDSRGSSNNNDDNLQWVKRGGSIKKRGGGSVFSGNSKEKIPGATGGRKAKMGGGGFRSELTQYEKARRPAVEAADDYLMDSDNNEAKLRGATRAFERAADETGYSNRKHGGRSKHAKGGKVGKGKTEIKIMIAPHTGQPQGGPQQPMGGMMPPMPVPQPNRPPQPGANPMAGGLDPNLAVAALAGRGAAPQPQPQMPMPMGRKTGGRVARTEHVIDHAAGGGLGRLEKIKAYGHKGK
jgi:hypothetical protein